VRKAKASIPKHEFDSLTFHNGESGDDFDALIGGIMNQLAILASSTSKKISCGDFSRHRHPNSSNGSPDR
jgi:hypothetical protein